MDRIEVDTNGYRNYFSGLFFLFAIAVLAPATSTPAAVAAQQQLSVGKKPSQADADQAMAAVQADVRRGDWVSALSKLRPFIQNPERFPTLYSDYLVILVWAGRYLEAIARFESLPEAVPRRAYLLRNLAKAYFDTRDYEKAALLYTRTLEQTPGDATALQGLVDSYVAAGRSDRAAAALEDHAESKNQLPQGLLKGRLLVEQARYRQALAWYDTLIHTRPADAETISRNRDDLIAGLSPEKQAELIRQLKEQAGQGDAGAAKNYILCLALTRRFQAAVAALAAFRVDPAEAPAYKAYWYAWALFKAGRPVDAEIVFSAIIQRKRHYLQPRIGRVYCLAALDRFAPARAGLEMLSHEYPDHIEVLFARAFVFEKQARFWQAIQVYDRILGLYPGNQAALRLRLRAFSDMGASSLAADLAERELPQDRDLQLNMRNDLGVARLAWGESNQAAAMLRRLRDDSGQRSHTYDYIAALAKADRNKEAAAEYKALEISGGSAGRDIPGWVKTPAAGSYASLGRYQRALCLYDQALQENPQSREARMGKFYVLQDLRKWDEAEDLLASLEKDTPAKIKENGKEKVNPAAFELALERGWFLAEQNRLKEADAHFSALRRLAPANLEVRSAQAHVHLWRGWPRRALEEFRVIDTLQPVYQPSQPGKLTAMNALAQKRQAREQVRLQLEKRPEDRHLLQVRRSLAVEQMNILRTEAAGEREDDDTMDLKLRQVFSKPLSLKSRLYTYLLWRRTWRDTDGDTDPAYFRRVGVGIEHIFNATWRMDTAVSGNYDDGQDVGLAGRLSYTPSDVWSFAMFGDSFSTDVPRRARLDDIEASYLGVEGTFRQSEWREIGAGYKRSRFSDGNERTEAFTGYEQNLWVGKDWCMRLYLDLYSQWNSKGDSVVYFNPEQAWSVSATHMTEQTILKHEQRAFLHRLYITIGSQQQKGFSGAWIGSLRYEHEYEFSDRHFLMVGIATGRNVYDGEAVQDINADLVYQWRF